jgi:hypothetical protein
MTRLTEDERNVELFAKRKKVIDVVADLVVLEYEAAGEGCQNRTTGKQRVKKGRTGSSLLATAPCSSP